MQIIKSLAVAALVVSLAACSHKTVNVDGATITTDDKDNKTMTVTTKDGTATVGKDAVDLSKIGVPIYPGAQQGEGGMSVANGTTQMTTMTTSDSFDKVYDWYKGQLPNGSDKLKMTQGSTSSAEFEIGGENKGDAQTVVTISGQTDKTTILIVKGVK
jgi:hypothetical protein